MIKNVRCAALSRRVRGAAEGRLNRTFCFKDVFSDQVLICRVHFSLLSEISLLLRREWDVAGLFEILLAVGQDPLNEGQRQPGGLALGGQVLEASRRGGIGIVGNSRERILLDLIDFPGIGLSIRIDIDGRHCNPGNHVAAAQIEDAVQVAVANAKRILEHGIHHGRLAVDADAL